MKHPLYQPLVAFGNALQQVFLLAVRLIWGWQFFISGFGKWGKIDSVREFFQTLHIPFPTMNAYLVASVETFGGILLILGLFSRLASIPLSITMIVALLTAHTDVVSLFTDIKAAFAYSPFTFLMAALIVFVFGPGRYSLDALFKLESSSR